MVRAVPFAGGALDIDTADDYRNLLARPGHETS
jgi:hypothetical protein